MEGWNVGNFESGPAHKYTSLLNSYAHSCANNFSLFRMLRKGLIFLLIHITSYLSTPLVSPFKYFLLNEVFDVFKKESTINQTRNSAIFYSRLKDNQEWTHFYSMHWLNKQHFYWNINKWNTRTKHWHSFGLFLVFWNWVSLRINYYNTFSTLIAWLDNSTNHVNLKTL